MRLCNSYIFIPNPYKKKDTPKKKSDGGVYLDLTRNFASHFTRLFPKPHKEGLDLYIFSIEYSNAIEHGEKIIEAKFQIHEVGETYFLDIIIEDNSKAIIIQGLEYIQLVIESSNIPDDYIEIVSYDAISEFYCNRIYPKLNELERNLRKLLFNIYVVNFGMAYYQTTISEDLQSKVKSVIKARGNDERKEIERIKKFFYSMEFADIEQMLFIPHWTEAEETAKSRFLKKHPDLSKLTDVELREAFSSFSPKSDWERFFADKMDADVIRSLMEEIRSSRNSIAHCKFFYREEYEICRGAIARFNKAVTVAIKLTESKDFSEKNNELIKDVFASIAKQLEDYRKSFVNLIRPMELFTQQIKEIVLPTRDFLAHVSEIFQKTSPFDLHLKPLNWDLKQPMISPTVKLHEFGMDSGECERRKAVEPPNENEENLNT